MGDATLDQDTEGYVDLVNAGVGAMIRTRTTTDAVEAIIALAEPVIRADERERLVEAWLRDARSVHFNKAGGDLTPTGRVAKWLRTVAL